MSFAPMMHLAEGLCLCALLVLKVENSLICRVGTHTNSVHDKMAIYFAFEGTNNK
jgi:hypothetical protein